MGCFLADETPAVGTGGALKALCQLCAASRLFVFEVTDVKVEEEEEEEEVGLFEVDDGGVNAAQSLQ
jgi:hypothetical protein